MTPGRESASVIHCKEGTLGQKVTWGNPVLVLAFSNMEDENCLMG